MRIAAIQLTPEFGRVAENRRRAGELVRRARADLAVLPEVAFTGYVFHSREELARLAEPLDGETAAWMIELAAATGTLLCYGFPERLGDLFFNSAALVGPNGMLAVYRKIHLFMDELGLFTPGREPFSVHEINGVRLGMMVCFDWYFPESARSLALQGAQILLHPANLVLPFCQNAMVTRSLENRVFTVTANRGGAELRQGKEMRFTGCSQITRPDGSFERLPDDADSILLAEIDPRQANDKNITISNHLLKDRRPELYFLDRGNSRFGD
ncbi:MAG: acyltransferase [Myxococcales bacterium]|nr:acyltransferase [Myxococcales bacterium]